MKIAVVGLGYVGLTTALGLVNMGHDVLGFDIRDEVSDLLNASQCPTAEPGLQQALEDAVRAGHFHCSSKFPGLEGIDVIMVCVGTPLASDGRHDLGAVEKSTSMLASALAKGPRCRPAVIYRATFVPGTMRHVIEPIFHRYGVDDVGLALIYNPEFLREGSALADFANPSRTVAGLRRDADRQIMETVYAACDAPLMSASWEAAEMVKLVDNTWHAMKVSFANELGRTCRAAGVPTHEVTKMFLADHVLNISEEYLTPGRPFGGSCLPKDVSALYSLAQKHAVDTPLFAAILDSNDAQMEAEFDYVCSHVPNTDRILLAGLAFKRGTDDLRGSASASLARRLMAKGYTVDIHDPVVASKALHSDFDADVVARLVDEADIARRSYGVVLLATDREIPITDARVVIDLVSFMA